MVIMLPNKRVNGNYALHSLVVFGSFVLCGNRYLHTAPPAMAVYTTQRLRLTKGSTLIYDKDGHFHCPSRSSSRTGQSRGLRFYPLHLLLANTTDSPLRPCIAS